MKTATKSCIFFAALLMAQGCTESFLNQPPQGVISEDVLADSRGIHSLLVGTYSMLDGVANLGMGWESAGSNWLYGSMRGMEANLGADAASSGAMPSLQVYQEGPANAAVLSKWRALYEGIARANLTLRVIERAIGKGTISSEDADVFTRQARVLRGFFHFEAWRLFFKIPYYDTWQDVNSPVSNTPDVRERILDDLMAGLELPENMSQPGRFNATVARVLLAKAYMQMNLDFATAKPLLSQVVSAGFRPDGQPVGLEPHYGDIFDVENRNGIEAIYTIQYAVNDGSGGWNGGYGEVLNFPVKAAGSPGGCCGFFQPNQGFVNAFRTREGLPLLDGSFDANPVASDAGLASSAPFLEDTLPVDPRLDWTVGRRGIPFLDWGDHPGKDWVRDHEYGGPYTSKKSVYRRSQEQLFTEQNTWTQGFTANGYRMIRYADVVLLLAECCIETNDLARALELINRVRNRAANPDGFVMESNGTTPAARYEVSPYPSFPDKSFATRALQMERLLELGLEGHRMFDLNRWGISRDYINGRIAYERTLRPAVYSQAQFGPEDVILPIPQREIDLSRGVLIQNR